jgi:pyruvate dehydrogenase (quinone)
VLDVFIDPSELPIMPHISADHVWKFGVARAREMLGQG